MKNLSVDCFKMCSIFGLFQKHLPSLILLLVLNFPIASLFESLSDSAFWQQTRLPPDFLELLLHEPDDKFFLLEPFLLLKIHNETLNCKEENNSKECFDQITDLKLKYNITTNPNQLTLGVFDEDFLQINLRPFTEVSRIECPESYQDETPFHVFYHFSEANLTIHLIVFLVDKSQENTIVCQTCPTMKTKLGLRIPHFTSCLLFEHFGLTTKFGVLLPENIPRYFAQQSELQYPKTSERVKAVDEKLRLFAGNCTISPENYIHPNATAEDLSSHNEDDPGTTMNSACQLERALHLSLDIVSPCSGSLGLNLTLLVLVFNRATDFARRQAIRQTYGQVLRESATSEIYFFIAKPEDSLTQEKILTESAYYGDLIQVDYTDSYYNCTIKAVAMLRWTALNCPYVKFMLKLDDDSFLRPLPSLRLLEKTSPHRMYGCYLLDVPVERSGKWAISRRYYPLAKYPLYIPNGYLIPGNLTIHLYEAVLGNLPALPFEDVYITGILAQTIGLSREAGAAIQYKSSEEVVNASSLENVYFLFNGVEAEEMRYYWTVWKDDL